mgnify:FL=1
MICTIQLISEKKDAKQKRPSTNEEACTGILSLPYRPAKAER